MTALPDEKSAANLLFNEGLIKNNVNCSKCGNPMQLRSRANGYEWRCRSSKSKDCSSESIRRSHVEPAKSTVQIREGDKANTLGQLHI
ncbi:hypothetical protein L5515_011037 [Caenorhabditis briggsae]|uniref:Recombinase zinc beta ribbon domain-containing protein n=1 Tax=Caenorhabditis briggsae TaxID=6238 RepID=A0AAE9ENS6_CAEBR|nr:hypothetical protein L5515_011037 [Caenorhabditis briggsae]